MLLENVRTRLKKNKEKNSITRASTRTYLALLRFKTKASVNWPSLPLVF